jgi:hypothetical protein
VWYIFQITDVKEIFIRLNCIVIFFYLNFSLNIPQEMKGAALNVFCALCSILPDEKLRQVVGGSC